MNTKLLYIASTAVPAATASSVHVGRMCAALGRSGTVVELLCKQGLDRSLEDYFGMATPFTTHAVPFDSRWALPGYLRVLERLRSSVRVAHGRYAYGSLYCALRGTPVSYEVHAPATGIKRQVEQRLLRNPKLLGVVAITQALADEYLRQYPALDGRLCVLPDAADDPGASRLPSTSGRLVAAYAGGWYAGRGIELIVALARAMPQIDFRLAGGSHAALGDWASGAELPPNLRAVGYLEPARVADFLAAADVLLAPYGRTVAANHGSSTAVLDTTRWCSPMKLFEYLAQGKAILCSALPVLQEVMRHEDNALLVEPENLAAWVAALQRLDHDRSLAVRLAQQARRDYLSQHSWDRRAERLLRFIRDCRNR
ncbi:MAG: glycosyltransferase [Pseudomonadota bacterium]